MMGRTSRTPHHPSRRMNMQATQCHHNPPMKRTRPMHTTRPAFPIRRWRHHPLRH
ncbi:hypothetical protein L286_16330 [Sphingobium sp. HDIP04]|nr:hypothetical protein L286_16330 [Sphingobium sp. HDIP04]